MGAEGPEQVVQGVSTDWTAGRAGFAFGTDRWEECRVPSCFQAPWCSSYLLLRHFQRQKNGRWGEALPETEGGGLVGAAVGVRLASVSVGDRER